ncbi:MAG: sensor histidine kinase [Terriglobales bacterium]
MKLPQKERLVSSAVVFLLALVLIVLAALQYRWSREVSEAASVRMKANLQSSLMSWRQDFYRELAGVVDALQVRGRDSRDSRLQQSAERFAQWSRTAVHPRLVANLYVWQDSAGQARLLRLNRTTDRFEPAEWPSGFEQLHAALQARSSDLPRLQFRRRPRPPGAPPADNGPRFLEHVRRLHGPFFPVFVAQDVPALVYPAFHPESGGDDHRVVVDWYILQLGSSVLHDHIFPELSERYFGGSNRLGYRVAVVSTGSDPSVVYTSDAKFGPQNISAADAAVPIFGPLFAPPPPPSGAGMPPSPEHGPGDVERAGFPPGIRIEPLHYRDAPYDWQLVVQNRGGSLDAVAASVRHRDLAISFGVLLILAATMGLMLVSTHRAQRLARLQMDFVTGVSHELRTPLAVISTAAENIADGVVADRQQLARYGIAIKTQARQLTLLVEQILLFAATRERRYQYNVRTLQVGEFVEPALTATTGLAREAGFTIEANVAAGLPAISGDLLALSQCLQNLITNAVKYGGSDRRVLVAAGLSGDAGEILVSVEDHGAGIPPGELGQIFEPFYRSPSATAAQIHGSGLGLPLARSIAEAMGGRLTVTSELGKGSCFVLHLPVADAAAPPAEPPAREAAKVS